MTVPLVRTLQRDYKEAKITWIISQPAFSLVEGMDGVEFIVIKKPKALKDYYALYQMLAHRKFDVLLAAQASLRTNLIYPLIQAKRKIGYDKARTRDGHLWFIQESISPGHDHTLEALGKFAYALGSTSLDIRFDLPLTQAHHAAADAFLKDFKAKGPLIMINPMASAPERTWTLEGYREVIAYALANHDAKIVLTGGPSPSERLFSEAISKGFPIINAVGLTQPKELLALLSKARVLICPDTGPSHMATAVNTPVIALHAVTNPDVSGPYLSRQWAINEYPAAIQARYHKPYTEVIWGTKDRSMDAMKRIKPEDVIEKLELFLMTL